MPKKIRTEEEIAYNKAYQKIWYRANRQKVYDSNKRRTKEAVTFMREYKSSRGCKMCGQRHPAALDFHHRDPSQKISELSRIVSRGWGKDRFLKEAEKCDIICSNCHRILHYEQFCSSAVEHWTPHPYVVDEESFIGIS